MEKHVFQVREHVVPCLHIREDVLRTNKEDKADWRMSVKQYIPLDNMDFSEGDITILSAPALGYPKELYEPMWDELYHSLKARGLKIKSIWIADPANLGSSTTFNKHLLYDPSNTTNHSRDLFNLVNQFPASFTHPIIGIGHSIGGAHLTLLAHLHPGLFTSLILLDPILVSSFEDGNAPSLAKFALTRPHIFPSYEIAKKGFNKAFKKWDTRVLDLFVKYGLQDLGKDGMVELVTGRYPEVTNYLQAESMNSKISQSAATKEESVQWALGPPRINSLISMVSTPTLILAGGQSPAVNSRVINDWKTNFGSNDMFRTPGKLRNVRVEIVKEGGHFFPFEDPSGTTARLGEWLESAVGKNSVFHKEMESVRVWRALDVKEKKDVVVTWMKGLKSKI